jgi:hypothetical protein
MSNRLNKYILKQCKLFLLINILFWFVIGLLLGLVLEAIGFLGEFKHINAISVASFFALFAGILGGVRYLLKLEE